MIEYLAVGWSLGAISMIMFDQAWNAWDNYMKVLKASKCNCKEREEE